MYIYFEQRRTSHGFSFLFTFAKNTVERLCGPSCGALAARPIVLQNNQDHIGLSRIKNINFKLSRWHRSILWRVTYCDPEGAGCDRAGGDQWHRSHRERDWARDRDCRYINIKKRNGIDTAERSWRMKGFTSRETICSLLIYFSFSWKIRAVAFANYPHG